MQYANKYIDLINLGIEARARGEKIYMVLPGGGACGRWQMGVIAYIEQSGLLSSIDGIVGTSVGGLNALITAKYRHHFSDAVAMWERIKRNEDVYIGKLSNVASIAWQLFISNKKSSLLNPAPLYKILERELGTCRLRDFVNMDVVTTAADITTGEMDVYTAEECDLFCSDLAKRTSAIPIIFPAIEGQGRGHLHVDGGVSNNNPVMTAIERGATKIIIIGTAPVDTSEKIIKNEVFDTAPAVLGYGMHRFEALMWERVAEYEKRAKVDKSIPTVEFLKVYPVESTGSVLDFSNVEQLQKGYDFAVEILLFDRVRDWLEK